MRHVGRDQVPDRAELLDGPPQPLDVAGRRVQPHPAVAQAYHRHAHRQGHAARAKRPTVDDPHALGDGLQDVEGRVGGAISRHRPT
jgi:hypothetical protein